MVGSFPIDHPCELSKKFPGSFSNSVHQHAEIAMESGLLANLSAREAVNESGYETSHSLECWLTSDKHFTGPKMQSMNLHTSTGNHFCFIVPKKIGPE